MSICKFYWFQLPKQVKEFFTPTVISTYGEVEGKKILDNINWFTLPTKINKIVADLNIAPEKEFKWFLLPEALGAFCKNIGNTNTSTSVTFTGTINGDVCTAIESTSLPEPIIVFAQKPFNELIDGDLLYLDAGFLTVASELSGSFSTYVGGFPIPLEETTINLTAGQVVIVTCR